MKAVVGDCLAVEAGEEVLVVCNPVTEEIGALMRIEAQGDGADATLAVISERDSHAAEPPRAVAAAMAAADVVLAPTIQSLSHTAARKAASEAGVRIATLPGVTEEMLARLMSGRPGRAAAPRLGDRATRSTRGSEARITCRQRQRPAARPRGPRRRSSTPANSARPGAFGNLPCGEGFIAPVEGTARARWSSTARSPAIGLVEYAGRS